MRCGECAGLGAAGPALGAGGGNEGNGVALHRKGVLPVLVWGEKLLKEEWRFGGVSPVSLRGVSRLLKVLLVLALQASGRIRPPGWFSPGRNGTARLSGLERRPTALGLPAAGQGCETETSRPPLLGGTSRSGTSCCGGLWCDQLVQDAALHFVIGVTWLESNSCYRTFLCFI